MADDRQSLRDVDAFILFNESEERVPGIVEQLASHDISTYFWRRDIRPGETWRETEAAHVKSAAAIVVFLGSRGWGPTHLKIAQQAAADSKYLIPVLIGHIPDGSDAEVDELFRSRRYIDLRDDDPKEFELLVETIRERRSDRVEDASYDALINKILDGNESERQSVLQWVRRTPGLDRQRFSNRLSYEIEMHFSAPSGHSFPDASRPPDKFVSIRSWLLSCLISTDCESQRNRGLILTHLDARREPEPIVRYWILSQLHAARASYQNVAGEIALTDPAPEVALMGRALYASPDDERLLEECRARLSSSDLNVAWSVLRMLRSVAVPALAPEVCNWWRRANVESAEAYDSLFALCTHEMALAAAPLLEDDPGLESVMERIISVANASDPAVVPRFAVFVAALPEGPRWVQDRISSLAGNAGFNVLRKALEELEPDDDPRVMIPPFTPDTIVVSNDYLDIREDVQTLAAVMLAKEVPPPLAIGLFGDWGSGKSFFMSSLRQATEDFAQRRDPKLCAHVVSIWFNAWHYADTNLWASMVDFILEQLAEYVAPDLPLESRRDALAADLTANRVQVEAAVSAAKGATELVEQHRIRLEEIKRAREEKRLSLRDLDASTLQRLIEKDEALSGALKKTATELGLPGLEMSGAELAAAIQDTVSLSNQVVSSVRSIAASKYVWLFVPLLLVVLFGFPFLAHWIADISKSPLVAYYSVLIGETATVIGAVAAAIRKGNAKVRSAANVLNEAKRKIDEVLAEKASIKSAEEEALEARVERLKGDETTANNRLAEATAQARQLEEALEAAKRRLSLAERLLERSRSGDYQKHLGLISTIRHDFDLLAKWLQSPVESDKRYKPVDRIVLYIDDLDRCPEKKVLEVLEAVHLLLAYPIFVVVVGVDPRWLVHSLKHAFSALRSPDDQVGVLDGLAYATPQNYLEKIFQIPFSLRPMSQRGYANLIGNLLAPSADAVPKAAQQPAQDLNPTTPVSQPVGEMSPTTPTTGNDEPEQISQVSGATSVPTDPAVAPSEEPVVIYREAMVIRPWETRFAERLFELMPTPRAAKRFTNTYRILKAPLRPGQLSEFEGTDYSAGQFQVPMLLLAMTIGFPTESRTIFPLLLAEVETNGNPVNFLRNLSTDSRLRDDMESVHSSIEPIVAGHDFPSAPEIYGFWLPRVARFSFDLPSMRDFGRL
jgi:hypothetical protein